MNTWARVRAQVFPTTYVLRAEGTSLQDPPRGGSCSSLQSAERYASWGSLGGSPGCYWLRRFILGRRFTRLRVGLTRPTRALPLRLTESKYGTRDSLLVAQSPLFAGSSLLVALAVAGSTRKLAGHRALRPDVPFRERKNLAPLPRLMSAVTATAAAGAAVAARRGHRGVTAFHRAGGRWFRNPPPRHEGPIRALAPRCRVPSQLDIPR